MRDGWASAKVGLMVALALVGTYVVYRFVDEQSSGADGYRLWAEFEEVQGLVPKSKVLIAGIQVGVIEDIRLHGGKARIDLRMDPKIQVHVDGNIGKRSASLLGGSLLVIDPGTVGDPVLKDGDRIPTAPKQPGMDDIMASVGATMESARRVAAQVERVFGSREGGDQMQRALTGLTEALEGINRTIQANEQSVGNTIANVEEMTRVAGPKIASILNNVDQVTEDVRTIIGENREKLTGAGGDVGETVSSIRRAAAELEEVLHDVHEVTDRTARGKGTLGRLTNDEKLADEVEGIAEGIGDIVGPISRLQTIVGLRSEYNFLANTFKSYLSLRIQPREDRYYLIQLINDPRGFTDFTQTTVRRSPPPDGEPATFQETRLTTTDRFRFSLMFAKRIHFLTFRYGILESTGGVGMDLHFLRDRLEINADVFAFAEKQFPRFRTRVAYEIIGRLWLLGGIDDALNEASRDFFLGGMLKFNDEDLKSILPLVGTSAATGS